MRVHLHCGIGLAVVLLFMTIAAPSSRALTTSHGALTFTALEGGSNPPSQTVIFSKGNNRRVDWASSDSATWLNITPSSGRLTRSDQIVVTVNIAGLNAGVYTAMVTITAEKGESLSIPVTLSITKLTSSTLPPPPPPPSSPPPPPPSPSSPPPPPPTVSTNATLTWSPNAETDLAGYKIYVGNAPGVYGAPIIVGNVTSYVVSNLKLGNTYYFAISAYDMSGNESAQSAVVSKSIY